VGRGAWRKELNSERFKLLYDITHADHGSDVIRTIRDNHQYIGHFTPRVPGRHEIDDSQELNYRAADARDRDTGFKGYVAQEFVPTKDPRTSLAEAVKIAGCE